MRRHLQQLHSAYGEHMGVRVARKHISWYLAGRPGAGAARDRLMLCTTAQEQFALLDSCFEQIAEIQHKMQAAHATEHDAHRGRQGPALQDALRVALQVAPRGATRDTQRGSERRAA
jgi:hypothetical protein